MNYSPAKIFALIILQNPRNFFAETKCTRKLRKLILAGFAKYSSLFNPELQVS
jgi:hypothetical protein